MLVDMPTRRATCSCGSLSATCEGEPARVSMCHCLLCQKRTGSTYGVQARWNRDQVTLDGPSSTYVRKGDSGGVITFRFCPTCATTLTWTIDAWPDFVAVAVGGFADPSFPPPSFSVYEARRHPWTGIPDTAEHMD